MQSNKELIRNFYEAFQQLDWGSMIENYHDEVIFWDPVFENLDAKRVKAMWQMLCEQAKDFSLDFRDIKAGEEYGSCNWVAMYTFSKTGRPVINDVKAHFKFHEGKIVEHMDDFNLYKWSRQALGTKGWLLGWSAFVQNKIKRSAKESLRRFIEQNAVSITG